MKPVAMMQVYIPFMKSIDTVRQYDKMSSELSALVPDSIKSVEDRQQQAYDLARFVASFLKWDDSPALRRYTDLPTILKYRRGRCGEYANLYTAMALAIGIRARLIFDFSDHAWTEIWDGSQWVGVDSTLGEYPMLSNYAREDSGKPLSYILAFQPDKITDVTWTYARKKEEVNKRRAVMSPFVECLIEAYNYGAEQ